MRLRERSFIVLFVCLLPLLACGVHAEADDEPLFRRPVIADTAGDVDGGRARPVGGVDLHVQSLAALRDGGWISVGESAGSEAGGPVRGHVVRHDRAGRVIWQRRLAGEGTVWAEAVAAGLDDGSVVVGQFDAPMHIGVGSAGAVRLCPAGTVDAYVASFDGAGRLRWARQLEARADAVSYVTAHLVTVADDGSCYVAGCALGAVAFLTGKDEAAGQAAVNEERSFLARYDAEGTLTWVRPLPCTLDADRGAALAFAPGAGAIVAGTTRSAGGEGKVAHVLRYDRHGARLWERTLEGATVPSPLAVTSAANGAVFVTGCFREYATVSTGERHLRVEGPKHATCGFVACYAPCGRPLWIQSVPVEPWQSFEGRVLRATARGGCHVAGWLEGRAHIPVSGGAVLDLDCIDDAGAVQLRLSSTGEVVEARVRARAAAPRPIALGVQGEHATLLGF